MILERFYDDNLAQASYLVGCGASGEALVIDPNRDVEQYIRVAAHEGLRIRYVAETHIHADFVSGARELADRTGAKLYLSDEGGPDWKYAFAEESGAVLLRDNDTFRVGNVEFRVLHTPGHTPEHICFVVTDTIAADQPVGVFTGDFIFVNDVGRPDLLEKAANVAGTMERSARDLFRSLERFKREIPDFVQLWPGHGAGSACGKSLGSMPQSTLGYEKRFNRSLTIENEDEFVTAILSGQPEPPRYFAEMKRINKEGPPILGGFKEPARQPAGHIATLLDEKALIVDTRPTADFARGHLPGTISIPLKRSFTTWAGSLLPYDRDFYLIVDRECKECAARAAKDLSMIGLDRVAGYFGSEVIDAEIAQRPLSTLSHMTAQELSASLREGESYVVDVRGFGEWEEGHLPDVEVGGGTAGIHIPLATLTEHLDEIPRDRRLVVHCLSGERSAIAASVLEANGFPKVTNMAGGLSAWRDAGNPIEMSPDRSFEQPA